MNFSSKSTTATSVHLIESLLDNWLLKNNHITVDIKQLFDEVGHDIMNYQNQGLCYLPKPKAEADNTDTRF